MPEGRMSRVGQSPIIARFDDLRTGTSIEFDTVERIISARAPAEVLPALSTVDAAVRAGKWAFGFVGYDAAPGIDPTLVTRGGADTPLVWFAIADRPAPSTAFSSLETSAYTSPDWQLSWTGADHRQRVEAVRAAIAAGDTYQCNLTTDLTGTFSGDPLAYYRDLAASQRGSYNAFLDTGRHVLISASPELFFEWAGDRICVKPMKGTASRGLTSATDVVAKQRLMQSAKDVAENLMIVDLVRNDIARIAGPGTVVVDHFADCEKYDTVWQLTSTISGQTPASVTLPEIFTALFPCGSITGAPKRRTMEIIRDLETSPRGPYCGTIGYLEPGPDRRPQARFNVAIRTVVVDRSTGAATYGVGGGITWSSTAEDEYQELLAKASLLHSPAAAFSLIETFAIRQGRAVHLQQHLDRLAQSADYFDIPLNLAAVRDRIAAAARQTPDVRARLTLARDGAVDLAISELPGSDTRPVRLAVDQVPVDRSSRWTYHKTTVRAFIDAASRRHPLADDVVMVNDLGNITETTIANVAVRIDGRWFTPPVTDGCLPGIGRQLALAQGTVTERSISVAELSNAEGVATISSLRGWRTAEIARPSS